METFSTGTEDVEFSIKKTLEYIGEDTNREGLIDTPMRIKKSWEQLFSGYKIDAKDILKTTFTQGACREIVILKNIEFYSTCEHHFLPFFGKITIAYLPNKKVVGVSKLARLVEVYARRMQIQERMTEQIADDVMEYIGARGCFVICKAKHMCMTARGVEKQKSKMVTVAKKGEFKNSKTIRELKILLKA